MSLQEAVSRLRARDAEQTIYAKAMTSEHGLTEVDAEVAADLARAYLKMQEDVATVLAGMDAISAINKRLREFIEEVGERLSDGDDLDSFHDDLSVLQMELVGMLPALPSGEPKQEEK